MASFGQHINIAVIASGIIIVPLHSVGVLDTNQSLAVLGLGVLGGILPDLDSDNSKPIQIGFNILSIFIPLLFILAIAKNMSIVAMLAIWFISAVTLHVTLFKLFLTMTKHRGIFHSIPMGVFFAELTIFIFHNMLGVSSTIASIYGFFILFGFLIHLLLDELVSLNVFGITTKKSFGTAMKFYDKNNTKGSILLYIIIVTFAFFIPIEQELFFKIFETLKGLRFV